MAERYVYHYVCSAKRTFNNCDIYMHNQGPHTIDGIFLLDSKINNMQDYRDVKKLIGGTDFIVDTITSLSYLGREDVCDN